MSRASKPKIRQNRRKQGLNLTLEKLSADFRFNLNLKKGYFLSVAKNIEEKDDIVMFAIAKDQQTLVIDELPIKDLVREIGEIVA